MCAPDEGAIDPDFGSPTSWGWRLPSPEEAAARTHGLCRGKKRLLTDSYINSTGLLQDNVKTDRSLMEPIWQNWT